MEGRFFSLSYRPCCGPTGGGGGVNWRLREANNKYGIVSDMHNLFMDAELNSGSDLSAYTMPCATSTVGKLKKFLKKSPAIRRVALDRKLRRACAWFKKLNEQYGFDNSDTLVFHDCETAYAFSKSGLVTGNAHWVYHQQGSLYAEMSAIDGVESKTLECRYREIFERTVTAVGDLRFPSCGAKDGLITTDSSTEELVRRFSTGEPLYNGFTLSDKSSLQAPGETALRVLDELENYDGIVFITVANMNYAKAVERIPPLIARMKAISSGDVKWIVIGDGIKADEVSVGIRDSGIVDDVIWIRDYIVHDDILRLLQRSDVYVLLQRVSIFDYATIEAMACGNALLLSPVGGNLEVLDEGHNGFFMNPATLAENATLGRLLDKRELERMKRSSAVLEEKRFSDYKFLERYARLAIC